MVCHIQQSARGPATYNWKRLIHNPDDTLHTLFVLLFWLLKQLFPVQIYVVFLFWLKADSRRSVLVLQSIVYVDYKTFRLTGFKESCNPFLSDFPKRMNVRSWNFEPSLEVGGNANITSLISQPFVFINCHTIITTLNVIMYDLCNRNVLLI